MKAKKEYTRQWIFKTIAVLLPFFVLLLVEIVLRVCNYGYDTNLFLEDKTGTYYHLNPDISKKYFTVQENATQGNYELFPKEKKSGTIRIFVLGESTTVGFPYMHNGAFPRMLKYRLQFAYPTVNFEIINLSLTAVNSYTLYDFSKQLINYQPDAVLIYAGHNEYYGALGVSSSSSIGRNPNWIRATIALKEFKLGQWIFRLAARLKGSDKKTTDYSLTLMERMAHDQSVPYKSRQFQQGIDQFKSNMTDLLDLFGKHRIPVFISNLVYNQKDLKPFISSNGNFNASKQYQAGNVAYVHRDYLAAKRHYVLAKEYDGLRFRAPERINILIRDYARDNKNVHFVDAMREFEHHSPHGIMDSTLLLEHVHPNLAGQQLISNAFYKELLKSGILPSLKDNTNSLFISPGDYPFTPFDTIFGRISIWLLKESWPFNEPIPAEDPTHVRTYEEQIAGACAVKQINWFESMRSLYDYYKQKQDLGNALRVMEGLCLELPYEQEYFLLAGKLSIMQHKEKKALFYLNRANQLAPSPEARSLLDMIQNHQIPTNLK
ncbi:MAG: GDSL-type esterase/lipase family protein [Bacteroidota bacterium]|nr:GDSL-type esterase/lipase family protein [Bacteroidota bacterium]